MKRGRPRTQRVEESVNNMENDPNPMRAFAEMIAEAIQNRPPPVIRQSMQHVQPPPVQPAPHLANFKDFKLVGPPEFKGTLDPIEAQTWIEELEKVFEVARGAENWICHLYAERRGKLLVEGQQDEGWRRYHIMGKI